MWNDVGGPSAIARYNHNLGMTATTPASDAYLPNSDLPGWGTTTTTAADQVALVSHFAYSNSALNDSSRFYGLSLMEHVEGDEDWGITGGVPADVTVALKNGWVPIAPDDWQVNSIGWVAGAGRNYVLAILTLGSPSEAYGIATIATLSGMIYSQLSST
jgi:hypothetical protein